MALSADERHVMLLNFSTVMVPKEAPAWSPAKFFEAVKLIHQAGQASMVVGDHADNTKRLLTRITQP